MPPSLLGSGSTLGSAEGESALDSGPSRSRFVEPGLGDEDAVDFDTGAAADSSTAAGAFGWSVRCRFGGLGRLLGLALASHDEDVVVLGADQRGVVDGVFIAQTWLDKSAAARARIQG